VTAPMQGAMPPTMSIGPQPGSTVDVKADTLGLLDYLHSTYVLNAAREKGLRNLKAWLLYRFWVGLVALVAICAAALTLSPDFGWLVVGLTLLAVVGRIGAVISVTNRLQAATSKNILDRDPIFELVALGLGRNGIRLALLSASIFAILVYVAFATGVPETLGLKGGLAPTMASQQEREARNIVREKSSDAFQAAERARRAEQRLADARARLETLRQASPPAPADAARQAAAAIQAQTVAVALLETTANERTAAARISADEARQAAPATGIVPRRNKQDELWVIDQIQRALGLASPADVFKLLLWAFVAGFAERFVPDVLDRLVARAKEVRPPPPPIIAGSKGPAA
jgi:hypothetical protein